MFLFHKSRVIPWSLLLMCLVTGASEAAKYRVLAAVTDSGAKYMGKNYREAIARKVLTIPNRIYGKSWSPNPDTAELAGIVRIPGYTEVNTETDLLRLQQMGDGYLDTVHTLRDNYAADIVSLYAYYPAEAGRGVFNATAATAFYVVDYYRSESQLSTSHESGHIYGGEHDTAHDADLNNPWTYNHGFWATYLGQDWGTVMSYFGVGDRQEFYSNPDSTFRGVARGNALRCNVSRLHRERGSAIEGFRSPGAKITLQSRFFRSQDYGDVMATDTIKTMGVNTLQDSAELRLRSTKPIVIQGNFVVNRLAAFTANSGSGALAKKRAEGTRLLSYDIEQSSKQNANNSLIDENVQMAIQLQAGNMKVQIELPTAESVQLRIFDLQGKALYSGPRTILRDGLHSFNIATQNLAATKIYLLEIAIGKNRFIKRFVAPTATPLNVLVN